MADINMRILLSAVGGAGVSSAISSISSSLGKGGLNGALLGIGAAAATAAIGLGVKAVKAAGDFQTGLTTLSTGAGESAKNLKMVGDGMLGLAVQTGTSTKQLTDGMYMIESAGYHGKAGLDVLKNAAEGAKVGNADLGTVANATTTIMTDFASKNVTASQAVNTLIAVVSNGKTTMGDLSSSLAQILPTASAAGISLTDTSAAMATMTGEGIPAANAATYLRQTIIGLQAPSKGTVTALADIGLKSKDVSNEMKVSLPGALQMITDHLKKKFPEGSAEYVNALKNISGGSKTMQGMLDLTGQHLKTFKDNVVNIAGAVKQGGNSITGWAQVQQNFNFKMSQAKEVLETLMIRIGQGLLPAVTQLAGAVIPLISQFSDWIIKSGVLQHAVDVLSSAFKTMVSIGSTVISFIQHNQAAMEGLKVGLLVVAGIIITSLVTGFYAWAAAAGAAAITTLTAMAPILLVGAAIGLLVGGFILAYTHIKPFHDAVNGIVQVISSNFLPVLHFVQSFLVSTFTPVWQQLVQVFNTQIMPSIHQLQNTFHQIQPELQMLAMFIGGVLVVALGLVVGSIAGVIGGIAGFLQGLAIAIGGVIQMFSGVVQVVSGIVAFIVDLCTGHFNKLGGDLKVIFGGISNIFSGFGNVVRGIFTGLVKGVTGTMSGFATGVLGFFNQIVHGADHHTQQAKDKATLHMLQMKDNTLQSAQQMTLGTIQHLDHMRMKVSDEIRQTTDTTKKHALEMQLKVISSHEQMAVKSYQHVTQLRQGVTTQISLAKEVASGKFADMKTAAQARTLEMKDAVLKNAQDTERGQLKILNQQALDVQKEYGKAKDNATRTKLAEKYSVIQHQIEIKKGVLQHTTDMRTQVQSQLDTLRKGASDRFGSLQKDIQRIVGQVTTWLKNAWTNAVNWVVDKFQWLYNHNYYFKNLVDSIKKAFTDAQNFIHTTWTNVTNFLNDQWNTLVKNAQKLWQDIAKPFQDAWSTHISPALTSLKSSISGWVDGVVSQASQWGTNIINSLADGIRNAAGNVASAASDVAGNIAKFLGFHSPAEMGPGSTADQWMPNFMGMLHRGIVKGIPLLQSATNMAASTLAKSFDPSTLADQLSFATAPTEIYQSIKKPTETRAAKQKEEQEKKAARKAAEEARKEAAARKKEAKKEAAAEKKHVRADIKEIKAELHIHTNNTKLTHTQIQEIVDQATRQFGQQMGEEIRAQFGNI